MTVSGNVYLNQDVVITCSGKVGRMDNGSKSAILSLEVKEKVI